jgi:hypothetical protein
MAKRSSNRKRGKRSTGLTIRETVRVAPPRPQTITVRAAAPVAPRKPKGGRRRQHKSGGGGMMSQLGEPAIAGVVLGWINKNQPTFPTIAVLGRAGTLAVAAYYLRAHIPFASKLAPAFAAIAGYEYMMEGKIAGDDVMGVASQV